MRRLDFDAGLFGRLRAAAGQDWSSYVEHPFVLQLGLGTLPDACFRRFLVQDYLFLTHFARAYGLSVYKSGTLPDIRIAAAGLEAILHEIPLHVSYCGGWGLDEAMMTETPEAAETITYTRFVLDVGLSGDSLDLAAALLPCIAGYAEIGQRLLASPDTILAGNPYGAWIEAYDSEDYKASVGAAIDRLDELWLRRGGENRFDELSRIFSMATRLEADFWQMGLDAAATPLDAGAC